VKTLALVALALAPVAGSRLVQANAHMQRLGDLRLDRTPTLGAAIDAFGAPSSCRRIRLESGSIVRWSALGIRMERRRSGRSRVGRRRAPGAGCRSGSRA
jgi:hypothetical protein